MSFDIPANLEREIEIYALAEHISPREAAVKLLEEVLMSKKQRPAKSQLTDDDWNKLKTLVPGYNFFQKLPDGTLDQIEKASKGTRSEKLTRRG